MTEDACVVAARDYRKNFGWPVTVDGWAVWMLAGEAADGIDVPQPVAEQVLSRLFDLGEAAPVITVPGWCERWVFLVDPQARPSQMLLTLLAGHDIRFLRWHRRIELPPTRVPAGSLRWTVDVQQDGQGQPRLPDFMAVAGAICYAVVRSDG